MGTKPAVRRRRRSRHADHGRPLATIRAIAIDPAGNVEPRGVVRYTITASPAPSAAAARAAERGPDRRDDDHPAGPVPAAGRAAAADRSQARRPSRRRRCPRSAACRSRCCAATRCGSMMRLGRGAGVVRLRVFRAPRRRAVRPAGPEHAAAAVGRRPLRRHAARRARCGRSGPGAYVVEARAGASRRHPGRGGPHGVTVLPLSRSGGESGASGAPGSPGRLRPRSTLCGCACAPRLLALAAGRRSRRRLDRHARPAGASSTTSTRRSRASPPSSASTPSSSRSRCCRSSGRPAAVSVRRDRRRAGSRSWPRPRWRARGADDLHGLLLARARAGARRRRRRSSRSSRSWAAARASRAAACGWARRSSARPSGRRSAAR